MNQTTRRFEVRFLIDIDRPATVTDERVAAALREVIPTVMANARGPIVEGSLTVTRVQSGEL